MNSRTHTALLSLLLVFAVSLAAAQGTTTLPNSTPPGQARGTQKAPVEPAKAKRTPDVIFVPTPEEVVAKMLELAEVDKNDMLYDLGCGDGRIVVTAAQKYGARGVGIDIDPQRISESRANAKRAGVTNRVEFREADLFETDLRPATAVTLYLLTELNLKLRPKLLKELKPGTPVVSHDFNMGDWEPEQTVEIGGPSRAHTVYRWTIPARTAGSWKVNTGKQSFELALEQSAQKIWGTVKINGVERQISDGRVKAFDIQFNIAGIAGEPTMRFTGRVEDGRMTGTLTRDGGAAVAWSAERVAEQTVASK